MHTKRLYAVKAKDVNDAITYVERELDRDGRIGENNFFFINGVIDVDNNTYTTVDKDREWKELKSVEGVVKVVNEFANDERYDKLVEQLKLDVENHNWFNVEQLSSALDDISDCIENGFELNDQYITEIAFSKIDTFGIDNWYGTREYNEDYGSYLVVVDFHF